MPTNNPSIFFLNVDPEDEAYVRAHVPSAQFVSAEDSEQWVEQCRDAQVLSVFIQTRITKDVLEKLPNVQLICTRSVGFDHIDIEACAARGITVCNVPDYGSHVIAEHVFALLLATMRHIEEGNKRVREGVFDYHGLRGMALQGKTIGIVGTGKIGRKACRIARGFGMKILAYDIFKVQELEQEYGVQYVSLEELLSQSDIISLHVPSTPETLHMINKESIAQMKDGVILVNTARGSLIDSDALIEALDSRKIRVALLDVLENEAEVEADSRLVQHPHVITTPHIAFYADDSVKAMYDDSIKSITEWMQTGNPWHQVHPVHIVEHRV